MKTWMVFAVGLLVASTGDAWTARADDGRAEASGRGARAFQALCTHCHPGAKAFRAAKGREGWRRTVLRMAERYRRVFDEEVLPGDQTAIRDYLVAAGGPTQEW
ncbi:MAG: hypothetical protein HZB55_08980 [Deltaproteobacteria bacterium]|nr:hypothetical protein [Deltaproteobacteria bacterium]